LGDRVADPVWSPNLNVCSAALMRSCDLVPYESVSVNVVLYTRIGCHLCDDARQLLEAHGLMPILIDIDADPGLRARYHECVPVVEIDGKIRFRGRVDALLLRRLVSEGRSTS
jgi:glutaredoxin